MHCLTFDFLASFSDAELRKNVLQDFVWEDFAAARDGAQTADHLADLLAQQLGREVVVEGGASAGPEERCAGLRGRP